MYLSQLKKLCKENDNRGYKTGEKMAAIVPAINEKIESLEKDKQLPDLFFSMPGVASREDKQNKAKILSDIKNRISIDKNMTVGGNITGYTDNVLDGDTLFLAKTAANLYPAKFAAEEGNLNERNPASRLFRR